MKLNRLITKSLAIFLLLVFSQKIGVGIYLHNWLHLKNYKQSLPQSEGGVAIKYTCNCIDDFSMPLTETSIDELHPITTFYTTVYTFYTQSPYFSFQAYASLRAPPVLI